MCWKELDTWEEPGAEITCGDAIESYEKLATASEEFEPILRMAYGKDPFDKEIFMMCLDELAHTLGFKHNDGEIILEAKNA